MARCRWIVDGPLPAAENMAIDQALLDAAGVPGAGWTLRLYQWNPAALSLGYFQSVRERDGHVASQSASLVRRATGGGAILHHHELTYSLSLPLSDRWSGKHRELYDRFHGVILSVLADAGVSARLWQPVQPEQPEKSSREFLCFLRRAAGDIVLGEWKIGGSAQRRSDRALLQHGSLLLQASPFAPELPGIRELAGVLLDPQQLGESIAVGFSREFALELERGQLSSAETVAAEEWRQSRFAHPAWNTSR